MDTHSSGTGQLRARLAHCLHELASSRSSAEPSTEASTEPSVSRCLMWSVTSDPLIEGQPAELARATISQARLEAAAEARALRLLTLSDGVHRSEFKSPPPPHELRFHRGAEMEIRTFLGALARMGAATPSVSMRGRAGTAVHCHVNVRNADAGGEPLTALEILNVWMACERVCT